MSITTGSTKKWGTEMVAKNKPQPTGPDLISYGECLHSLGSAMKCAGGSITYWTLEDMSAPDLIRLIAPNNIRFVYTKED